MKTNGSPSSPTRLADYIPTRITVGNRGYGVLVDDAAGAARLIKSSRTGVSELSRFPFADNGRPGAIAGAVLTALDLDQAESSIEALEAVAQTAVAL